MKKINFIINYGISYIDSRFLHMNYQEKKVKFTNIISAEECNDLLGEKIDSDEPFMACKFGSTELANVTYYSLQPFVTKKRKKMVIDKLYTYSGFFPNDYTLLPRFSKVMFDTLTKTDILANCTSIQEQYLLEKYAPTCQPAQGYLTPWDFENPWTSSLKGKKVLVIHPFADTIRNQYERREKLFENKNVLPEFELHTIKAVQTLADETDVRFSDWFEALDFMCSEAKKIDFDIALIGCGAYGMPLAAKIKEMGKSAIHMGGSLQLLFGICGKRWDDNKKIKTMRNEYWVRPSEAECIKAADLIEGGCYW